ncbi:MAG: hypothetical protein RLY86_1078 [Pseudomonadota bacterium]|jgi:hypothetical protein
MRLSTLLPPPRPRPVLTAATVAVLVLSGTSQSLAQQTIGDIATQGRPVQTAPVTPGQPARPATPAIRPDALPTIGDLATGGPAQPQANAGCTPPPLPTTLPDGAEATEAQMKDAHTAFRSFVTGGEAFIACLEDVYKANADRITVGDFLALTQAHNNMITVMEALAAGFNAELREYRAKGGR